MESGLASPDEVCRSYEVGILLLRPKLADNVVRDDVTTLLTKAGSNLTVKTLLDNLAITTEFESSISKKWATPVRPLALQ